MKKIKIITSATLLMLAMAACTKETTGPAGANGINGTNGTNGNQNVTVSYVIVESWMWTYDPSVQTHYYTWYNSNVKSASFYNICVDRGTSCQALPYKYNVGSTNIQYDFAADGFATNPNIELQYRNYNSPATAPTGLVSYEIKIAN